MFFRPFTPRTQKILVFRQSPPRLSENYQNFLKNKKKTDFLRPFPPKTRKNIVYGQSPPPQLLKLKKRNQNQKLQKQKPTNQLLTRYPQRHTQIIHRKTKKVSPSVQHKKTQTPPP
jgi:hypothetical protein